MNRKSSGRRAVTEEQVQREARTVLIAARQRAGLTPQALAKRLGRPHSFVAKIESGQRPIRLLEFWAIANALHLDAGKLLMKILG